MPNKWHTQQAVRVTSDILRMGMQNFGEILKDEINERAPGSIKDHTEVTHSLRATKVVNDHPAALFVEFGTAPHKIRPVAKKALRWRDKSGNEVFAKSVNHPGTAPQAFMRRGVRAAISRVDEAFRR